MCTIPVSQASTCEGSHVSPGPGGRRRATALKFGDGSHGLSRAAGGVTWEHRCTTARPLGALAIKHRQSVVCPPAAPACPPRSRKASLAGRTSCSARAQSARAKTPVTPGPPASSPPASDPVECEPAMPRRVKIVKIKGEEPSTGRLVCWLSNLSHLLAHVEPSVQPQLAARCAVDNVWHCPALAAASRAAPQPFRYAFQLPLRTQSSQTHP